MTYPYLSLANIELDEALARKLPRRLAYYHLALPLAQDGDEVSLVMASPDNQSVIAMLGAVMGLQVVPVMGAAEEIKAALDRVWRFQTEGSAPRFLCYGEDAAAVEAAQTAAAQIAGPFEAQITVMEPAGGLDNVLRTAREGRYSLIVLDCPQGEALAGFLQEAPAPILLLRGMRLLMQHLLLALRGHTPDQSVLNWAIPLAKTHGSQVTAFAVTAALRRSLNREVRSRHSLAKLLDAESSGGQHIAACTRRLNDAKIQGRLRLVQGAPEQQIAGEFARGGYDLLLIAAEARGDFVQRVVTQIQTETQTETSGALNQPPILIIKPIAD